MDNQVHNAIVNFIWGIADDCLRDVYVRGKYRDVILPMTVIRRLDALLEDTKADVLAMKKRLDAAKIDNQWPALCNTAGHAFCNASPFVLRDLTSRAKKQTLKADFKVYLDGFSPNVQVILDKFKFRNQIDTMVEADILGAVIEKFVSSDINLSPNPVYKDAEKTILKHPGLDNHGITGLPNDFRTGNMPTNLAKTGAFTELTGGKYQSQSTYLGRGDILVTKTSGHTVVVLTNGPKYEGTVHPVEYALGDRIIKYGCEGQDVKLMQEMLMRLGYDLGSWGCDGDFGDCTELAIRAFQSSAKLEVDGECGPETLGALEKKVEALNGAGCSDDSCPINVIIFGGNCYIRTAPNTDGKKLGVAHRGDILPYGGQVSDGGWLLVQHENQNAWVSGRYGKLAD